MKSNQVYCVKCRHACVPKGVRVEEDARGRARLAGKCSECGTKCFKYISADHPKASELSRRRK